jgi:pseudouridine synthase
LASRRKAETLIKDGVVRVNGVVVRELGLQVDPKKDSIEVRGRRVVRQKRVYIILHKTKGTVTTSSDPEGRPTVLEALKDVTERVFPVGRLDYNTSGVLILTNDGELSQALSHPSSQVPRAYRVKVSGQVSHDQLDQLRHGVDIGDGPARATDVYVAARTPTSTTVMMTIHEGRYHQIHRMIEAIGHRVAKLMRVSFGGLDLEGLRPGEYRRLRGRELGKLKKLYVTPQRKNKRA